MSDGETPMPQGPAPGPEVWDALIGDLEEWISPQWVRAARDFGSQPWIRLILMVDAHATLSQMQPTEKIAMTMADLATEARPNEQAGWEAIVEKSGERRVALVASLVDRSESVLPPELLSMFARSVEPFSHMNG
ncbi:MAG: hypothetical protein KDC33_02070 [Thermoleophilia bacterium]|nr:hypothetical protein [Thermoleophilia bacterium]